MSETNIIDLNPGDVQSLKLEGRLRAPALGSCIALVLYDNVDIVGGMAHVMFPSTDHYLVGEDPLKYADEAVPYLLKLMVDVGANRYGLHARLVGGAMITPDTMNIGEMVEKSVEEILKKHNIEVVARRIGGNVSRTATLDVDTGTLWYSENSGIEHVL
jgi:chemotaxis protein CheD